MIYKLIFNYLLLLLPPPITTLTLSGQAANSPQIRVGVSQSMTSLKLTFALFHQYEGHSVAGPHALSEPCCLARDQLGRSSAGSSIEVANGCHFKIITCLLLLDVLLLTW